MTAALALPAKAAELAAAVPEREYLRLLGLPRGRVLEGDLLDRANRAHDWYARFGHPFVATRRVGLRTVGPTSVTLETGAELRSAVLADRLRTGEGHALVALAASAGREVADETARLWATDRPDEAFFLDRFAVAVTERLVLWASATICRASEPARETLLPHLSPGCGQWDLADQHRLMALLTGDGPESGGAGRAKDGSRLADRSGEGAGSILGPIELLPSGALHPQHSVLAALGVTHRVFAATPEDLCRSCDLDPCAFRRAPASASTPRPQETR